MLAGSTPKKLSVLVFSTPRTGFETKIAVNSNGPFFQVKALNSSGQVIGRSRIAHVEQKDDKDESEDDDYDDYDDK